MLPTLSRNGLKRLVVGGILAVIALPVVGVGFVVHTISDSHKDYDRVVDCLQRHDLAVVDGWKRTDIGLEDFGLIFKMADGQQWEVQILDGYKPRNCRDRISGLFLSSIGSSPKKYLSFTHPELVEDLAGQEIRTVEDMFAQLEWLLTWAAAHPDSLLARDDVTDAQGYMSLLSVSP